MVVVELLEFRLSSSSRHFLHIIGHGPYSPHAFIAFVNYAFNSLSNVNHADLVLIK